MGFSSGMQVMFSDFNLNGATRIEYSGFPTVFGFGFLLSGNFILNIRGLKKDNAISSGQSVIYHLDSPDILNTFGMPQRVTQLVVMMEPKAFQAFLRRGREDAFSSFHRMAPSQHLFSDLTPAMRCAMMQMRSCPYQGVTRDFYLESKVFELISYKLDQIESERPLTRDRTRVKSENIDKVQYVGELMTRNIAGPPGIAELASQVGMCQSVLYRCFKAVYGMGPVYELCFIDRAFFIPSAEKIRRKEDNL